MRLYLVRSREIEVGRSKSEVRRPKMGDRRWQTEVGSRKTEDGRSKMGDRS